MMHPRFITFKKKLDLTKREPVLETGLVIFSESLCIHSESRCCRRICFYTCTAASKTTTMHSFGIPIFKKSFLKKVIISIQYNLQTIFTKSFIYNLKILYNIQYLQNIYN